MKFFEDLDGRKIRLTDERRDHIERRPEMNGQLERIEETLKKPDGIRISEKDVEVHLYHKKYGETPVSGKFYWSS